MKIMENNLLAKIAIILIASLLVWFNLISPVLHFKNKFTEKYNPKLYELKYNRSQYVIPQSKNPISDEEIYSHAGYMYAKGLNPILINSDHPPLGKYFIGWLTLLTGNHRISSLVFGFGSLLLIFLIIYTLTKSFIISFAGVGITSVDTILLDQIIYSPILDIIQVFFLLAYVLFFIFYLNKNKKIQILGTGITLGAMASTKMYFPAIILLGVSCIYLFLNNRKLLNSIFYGATTFLISFLLYVSTYFNYFIQNGSLKGFFGSQKWIFLYWKENSVTDYIGFGDVIPFILLNKWKIWWGDRGYIAYEHWTIFWPIFFVIGLSLSFYYLIKLLISIKKKEEKNLSLKASQFLSLWIILVTLYMCIIPISPRYLMMLFFPIYILTTLFLHQKLYNNVTTKTK